MLYPSYVYVASSWRNALQRGVVRRLRDLSIPHYDFRNPDGGTSDAGGFRWTEVDREWAEGLRSELAQEGFESDRQALEKADCVILVLPAGRSAHIEAAWAAGKGKTVYTLAAEPVEPELMQLLLGPPENIITSLEQLDLLLAGWEARNFLGGQI